jgi:class 3 adenylate cyclase
MEKQKKDTNTKNEITTIDELNTGLKRSHYNSINAIDNDIFNLDISKSNLLSNSFLSKSNNNFIVNDFLSTNMLLNDSTLSNQFKLSEEINELKRKLMKSAEELKVAKKDKDLKISEFEEVKNQLIVKEKINHILTRISEDGRKKLLESENFQSLFDNSNKYDTVVVSIDIRRSTELMLKARTPELFSKFITELSLKLSKTIINNFGIFDKFTGDGILAFFPKFYSGNEAMIRAIKATLECHQIFADHYATSKNCFNVFIKDVGLGIGIDYGNVTLVNTQSELTVVGVPVVYACRFSGTKAGETLLNQPAMEEIMRLCPQLTTISESEIAIKNEGIAIGYNVNLNESAFEIENPDWDKLYIEYKNK